ncbi:ERF family protein [Siminovitchia terrae]|uniref:ERF family protein n=1 Tax=Siminovitchia terrae TaxID=1914933 RepID=UPI0028A77EB9|nr:ERF family protein [Siminovitchia terrae]
MEERKLVKKLAKVMSEVKRIEKKGYNKFHKYNYATESDVSEKVREVLAEQNVVMLPDVVEHSTREHKNQRGNTEYIATVMMKFTFIDGETGESLSIHSLGEGQDAGDKAVYKAITGATKYALMKAFMIPTGDDPEADTGMDERNAPQDKPNQEPTSISQKQVGLLKAKALDFGKLRGQDLVAVYEALNISDITKLTTKQASAAIRKLEGWLKKAQEKQGA